MPRDNYDYQAHMQCQDCKKVVAFSYGYQGNMSECSRCSGPLKSITAKEAKKLREKKP